MRHHSGFEPEPPPLLTSEALSNSMERLVQDTTHYGSIKRVKIMHVILELLQGINFWFVRKYNIHTKIMTTCITEPY